MKEKKKTKLGRKPLEDKKVPVVLFIRKSIANKKGFKDYIRKFVYDHLNKNGY